LDDPHRSFSIFSSNGSLVRDLFLAATVGLLGYLFLFAFLLHKPLTVGVTAEYFAHKDKYLQAIATKPKIVILAGSNGRFSHRCETIAVETGVECVNLSISADLGLLWQFKRFEGKLNAGDLLYLPLEYHATQTAAVDDSRLRVGGESNYVVAYQKSDLLHYSYGQIADALFQFDLRYLLSAIGEMGLHAAGKQRRFSVATMTPQGDEKLHTQAKGTAYEQFVNGLQPPKAGLLPKYLEHELMQMFAVLEGRGISVVGGLPTTFEDVELRHEIVKKRRDFFVQNGQCFVELQNRSLYPRGRFFDTAYHLNEEAQIEHSRALAPYLKRHVGDSKCQGNARTGALKQKTP
jgi:hypothetical protein